MKADLRDAWESCSDPVAMIGFVVARGGKQDPIVRATFECVRIAALETPEELYPIRAAIHAARMWLDKQVDSSHARKRKAPLSGLSGKNRLAAQAANAVLDSTFSVKSAPRAMSLAAKSLMTAPKAWNGRRVSERFCKVIREHVRLGR